jgi:exopolysaccharide biosynthesis polyprenyl glycosylphosphotransferase
MIHVAGIFDMDETPSIWAIGGVPVRRGIDALLDFTKAARPDLVVLTVPLTETGRLQPLIERLREQRLNVRIVSGELAFRDSSNSQFSRHELPGVQLLTVGNPPISPFGLLMKEVMDRVGALLALILLAPLLFVIACGIAMSSAGPVIFRQRRMGYNKRVFRIYKFRTMHNECAGSDAGTRKGDPRVNWLGKFLRQSSLDELPQLINVLLGDMSLVGPRPHMLGQKIRDDVCFEDIDGYNARDRVKPGITGWAQINGWRGPTHSLEQIQRRVEHDLYYIENWSIWLDIVILIRTVMFGLFGENAF